MEVDVLVVADGRGRWSWPMVVADLQRRQRTREHPCASDPTMTLVPQLLVVGFDDDARQ